MFFAKIPRHIRQNAITEGDLECILTRNCEGTEQLRLIFSFVIECKNKSHGFCHSFYIFCPILISIARNIFPEAFV